MDGYPRLIYIFTILFPTEIYIFPLFNLIQHYMQKFVSDLRHFGDFLRILRFSPAIKLIATI